MPIWINAGSYSLETSMLLSRGVLRGLGIGPCPNPSGVQIYISMNSMQTCNSVTFYFMKNSFSDVSWKWILPNMIRAGTALIIFGKIHFLLTSENEFFMKWNVTELQVCMEFMVIDIELSQKKFGEGWLIIQKTGFGLPLAWFLNTPLLLSGLYQGCVKKLTEAGNGEGYWNVVAWKIASFFFLAESYIQCEIWMQNYPFFIRVQGRWKCPET